MPLCSAAGIISHSISRDSRLYCWLKRHRRLDAHCLGRGDDELKLPPCEVRQPDVVNFAGLHRLIEKRQRFLHRRVYVRSVQLIEVDGINSQAP